MQEESRRMRREKRGEKREGREEKHGEEKGGEERRTPSFLHERKSYFLLHATIF